MRIFTAIEIPEEAKVSIQKIIAKIDTTASCKWVAKDNLHITLNFFGEVESPTLTEEVLYKISKDFHPFEISLSGLGVFPSRTTIRVLWVGADKGKEQLKGLYKDIEEGCAQLGFKREGKDYTPHVTIGRVKRGKLAFPNIDFFYPPFIAKKITLFESILKSSGPIYKVVSSFPEVES